MQQFRAFFVIAAVTFLLLSSLGCSNQAGVQEERENEPVEEIVSPITHEENIAVTVPQGKTDRLPGSLRWNSIELYAQGIDFFKDQPEGLSSADATADNQEETIAPQPSEPAQSADTASQTTDSSTQAGAGETSTGQDSGLPQDGDILITTVDDTTDWGSVLVLDDEEEDDGKKWYELD